MTRKLPRAKDLVEEGYNGHIPYNDLTDEQKEHWKALNECQIEFIDECADRLQTLIDGRSAPEPLIEIFYSMIARVAAHDRIFGYSRFQRQAVERRVDRLEADTISKSNLHLRLCEIELRLAGLEHPYEPEPERAAPKPKAKRQRIYKIKTDGLLAKPATEPVSELSKAGDVEDGSGRDDGSTLIEAVAPASTPETCGQQDSEAKC